MLSWESQLRQIRKIHSMAHIFGLVKYGQVGYPCKDHQKCSSADALTLSIAPPSQKSRQNQFLVQFPYCIVITMKKLKISGRFLFMGLSIWFCCGCSTHDYAALVQKIAILKNIGTPHLLSRHYWQEILDWLLQSAFLAII